MSDLPFSGHTAVGRGPTFLFYFSLLIRLTPRVGTEEKGKREQEMFLLLPFLA